MNLRIAIDRDSVCAADDVDTHRAVLDLTGNEPLAEVIVRALELCPLPSISGDKATWLVALGEKRSKFIGVIAQQWERPKLLIPEDTPANHIFTSKTGVIYFNYWCQCDPKAAFEAIYCGGPLPDRW